MITYGQARGMAEAQWGTGGTTPSRTNRTGAFYFSCSGHGGFIIDGRCLTQEERDALNPYSTPSCATEYYDPQTDKVHRFLNPFRASSRSFRVQPAWQSRSVDIFSFEEDCDWCLPVLFADIRTQGVADDEAMDGFKRHYATSNHNLLNAMAITQTRKDLQKLSV